MSEQKMRKKWRFKTVSMQNSQILQHGMPEIRLEEP